MKHGYTCPSQRSNWSVEDIPPYTRADRNPRILPLATSCTAGTVSMANAWEPSSLDMMERVLTGYKCTVYVHWYMCNIYKCKVAQQFHKAIFSVKSHYCTNGGDLRVWLPTCFSTATVQNTQEIFQTQLLMNHP